MSLARKCDLRDAGVPSRDFHQLDALAPHPSSGRLPFRNPRIRNPANADPTGDLNTRSATRLPRLRRDHLLRRRRRLQRFHPQDDRKCPHAQRDLPKVHNERREVPVLILLRCGDAEDAGAPRHDLLPPNDHRVRQTELHTPFLTDQARIHVLLQFGHQFRPRRENRALADARCSRPQEDEDHRAYAPLRESRPRRRLPNLSPHDSLLPEPSNAFALIEGHKSSIETHR
jgi:hypothetical protein